MVMHSQDMKKDVRKEMRGGAGEAHLTALLSELPAHMRLFSTIRLARGSSIGYHVHENETELFYFVSGRARVQDDDRVYELGAGDAMATPSGHGHGVESIGEEDLVLVAAIVKD